MSRRPIGLASASEASSRALRTRGSVGVLRCLAFAARSPRRMRLPIPLLLLLPLACAAAGFTPADLRTEYLVNPSGLGVPRPRFSWTLEGADPRLRGLRQTAYQIRVFAAGAPGGREPPCGIQAKSFPMRPARSP